MSSLHSRNGNLHISYYRSGKHYRYALKIKDTKDGWKEADKIQKQIDASIIQDRMKLIIFGVPEKIKSYRLSDAKDLFYSDKNIPTDNKGVYHSAVKSLIECIGDVDINELRQLHFNKLQEYLKALNKSHNTTVSYFNHIRIILKHFNINKVVPNIKMIDNMPTVITDKHLGSILEYFNKEDMYYLIKFLYHTGCRISEALTIKDEDIDYENNILLIHNHKAKRNDRFPLYPELKSLLLEYKHKDTLLFSYHKRYVLASFRKATEALHLPNYTLHDLRRTFATKYASKLSPTELKVVMRHKDISTTLKHYINHNLSDIALKL